MKQATKVQQAALTALTTSGQFTLGMSAINQVEHMKYSEKLRKEANVLLEEHNARIAKQAN